MAGSLIWTIAGDMRNLKPLEPSVEATIALARRRLIEHVASEIPCSPRKLRRASPTSSSIASAAVEDLCVQPASQIEQQFARMRTAAERLVRTPSVRRTIEIADVLMRQVE